MRKVLLTLCALLTMGTWSYGQGMFRSINTKVTFYTPSIVRVQKVMGEEFPEKESYSVILAPQDVKVKYSEKSKKIQSTQYVSRYVEGVGNVADTIPQEYDRVTKIYETSALIVEVTEGHIEFKDKNGKSLAGERGWEMQNRTYPGRELVDNPVLLTMSVGYDDPIYGLGILQEGRMNMNGTDRRMIQGNTDDYCNIIQSIRGFGIFWDNYSPTQFSANNGMISFKSDNGGMIDYYFIWGGDADGVIAGIRQLTGTVPMHPLWSYGFMQSRERYKTSAELVEVLDKYRATGVPIDCMIQDWQYWGDNYLWNAMEFNSPDFSNPERWIGHIHRQNAKLMISIWSSFGPMTKQYRELQPKGLLIDFQTWPQSGLTDWPPRKDYPSGVRPYDPFSQEARDIYWNHLTRLHNLDIDGWWMDSTEPDHMDFQESDLDLPTSVGPFRRVRNAFPLLAVGGVYDNQRAADSTKRVLILTRSAFGGQQRYGSNTWSGDLQSNWNSLRNQVPAGLNFALTGNPNFNSDLGGFFANSYNERSQDWTAVKNPLYQELYVRWMQYGIFCPMMRSHGTEVPRELYYYGEAGEPIYDALLGAIKMRYSLLPYIYATAHQVSAHNGTFQRALMMDFRDDKNVWDNGKEFMFGKSILVAPVLNAQYTPERATSYSKSGVGDVDFTESKSWDLYLPAGTTWYDWYTCEKFDGGQTIEKKTAINTIPTYVRAGGIIPIGPDVQYSTEKPWDNLEVRVYAGANGDFELYEDEGDNYNYEKGAFTSINFHWDDKSHRLTIDKRIGSYDGMIAERNFQVVLIDSKGARKPVNVRYTGKKTAVTLR